MPRDQLTTEGFLKLRSIPKILQAATWFGGHARFKVGKIGPVEL